MTHPSGKENLVTTTPRILEIGQEFMAALSVRDFERLETSFHEGVQFCTFTPRGIRGGYGAAEATGWLRRWFGEADEFEVLDSSVKQVGDHLHIAYCFDVRKHGKWQTIEQHGYCTVSNSQIDAMFLVSSGFRPEHTAQTEFHAENFYAAGMRVLST